MTLFEILQGTIGWALCCWLPLIAFGMMFWRAYGPGSQRRREKGMRRIILYDRFFRIGRRRRR